MDYPKTLRFTSQYRNYRIFFVSPTSMLVDGQLIRKPGMGLEFKNNECICNDPETIKTALLDGYYGKDYISPEWEKIQHEAKLKTEAIKNEEVATSIPTKIRKHKA